MNTFRSRLVSASTAFVLAVAAVAAVSSPASAGPNSLGGTVTQGGSPVTGVSLSLSDSATSPATTGATGQYQFANLGDGTYRVTPSAPNLYFTPASRTGTIAAGIGPDNLDFTAAPAGTVSGVVYNDVDNSGTRNTGDVNAKNIIVFVDLNNDNTFTLGEPNMTTGSNGAYTLTGVQPGAQTVRILVPSDNEGAVGVVESTPVTVVANATATPTVPLGVRWNSSITGTVKRDGEPVGNAYIGIDRDGNGVKEYAISADITGGYKFDSVPPGTWVLTPLSPQFYSILPRTRTVTLAKNSTLAAGDFIFAREAVANGYRMIAADGGVFNYGIASMYGSTGNIRLNQPIVGSVSLTDNSGYYLVARDGGVFAFGAAKFYGSTGAIRLNQPIVGMALTADEKGYYLFAADGGVFAFGQTPNDAPFLGSLGGTRLNQPIVAGFTDPDNRGYTMIARDGGVFNFETTFHGSTGAIKLNQPIVGASADTDGSGYWLVASDGGVFAFDAPFFGSAGGTRLNQPIVGMAAAPTGRGYYLVARDGGIFSFPTNGQADAPLEFYGSAGATRLNQPIIGINAL